MSHIVTDPDRGPRPRGRRAPPAAGSACPSPSTAPPQLFSGEATGLLVRLPDWLYPVVVDTTTGQVHFDNYNGAWGDQEQLDRFLQAYAVEKARIEARKTRPPRRRAGPGRRLHQADHQRRRCAHEDHRDHRRPEGPDQVETRGFTGGECREASRFVEQALGTRSAETLTAEFHQGQQPIGPATLTARSPADREPRAVAVRLLLSHSPHHHRRRRTMTLAERLSEYVRACFTGIWIQSLRA